MGTPWRPVRRSSSPIQSPTAMPKPVHEHRIRNAWTSGYKPGRNNRLPTSQTPAASAHINAAKRQIRQFIDRFETKSWHTRFQATIFRHISQRTQPDHAGSWGFSRAASTSSSSPGNGAAALTTLPLTGWGNVSSDACRNSRFRPRRLKCRLAVIRSSMSNWHATSPIGLIASMGKTSLLCLNPKSQRSRHG